MTDWAWIPITVAAAFFQSLRTALQKFLKGRLSTVGSTFTRFAFGVPFAAAYLALLVLGAGWEMPRPDASFALPVLTGAAAQVVGTALLLRVLDLRNVPVGVAYTKTEVVQAAVFGFVFLDDALSGWAWAAVALGTLGVMLISLQRSDRPLAALVSGLGSPAALMGMASGAGFAVAAVGFRGASLSLGHDSALVAAAYTLVWATGLQTLMVAAWLALREPEQFGRVARAWRPSLAAGLAGAIGSGCWFTAMTLQSVAHVRTLGLVELVFSFAMSALWFRERTTANEVAGVVLLVAAIAMILNAPAVGPGMP
jgi:drug/metabolite transporter (DMT)-like permease